MHLFNHKHNIVLSFVYNSIALPTEDRMLDYLNQKFSNIAIDNVFILRVTNVLHVSEAHVVKLDPSLYIQISVTFESECLMFTENELLSGVVTLILSDIVIATHMGAVISLIKTQGMKGLEVGDEIAISITKVHYDYHKIVLHGKLANTLSIFTYAYKLASKIPDDHYIVRFPIPSLKPDKKKYLKLFKNPDNKLKTSFSVSTVSHDPDEAMNLLLAGESIDTVTHDFSKATEFIKVIDIDEKTIHFANEPAFADNMIILPGVECMERIFQDVTQTINFLNNLNLSDKVYMIYKNM